MNWNYTTEAKTCPTLVVNPPGAPGKEMLPSFTREEYESVTVVCDYLLSLGDGSYKQEKELLRLQREAKELGCKLPKGLYQKYAREAASRDGRGDDPQNQTDFPGMKPLFCGKWQADDDGVRWWDGFGNEIIACPHPITILERLVNLDTGEYAVKLAFWQWASSWREIVVPQHMISDSRQIVGLSKFGVLVTSETARSLVDYLNHLLSRNELSIPTRKSVGRLGYISGEGFSPYVPGLTFDGEANFKPLYDAIHKQGSFEAWQKLVLHCREESVAAKIMVAASLAAPLVAPLGVLPFFVHLWGVDSGTGKTVGLMLAASVWGDPEAGKFLRSFNSTSVGLERTVAFLNHLPLCLDELQLSKDTRGNPRFNVYELAEGQGRTRGTKYGGTDLVPTWRNCFLTTGESPLVRQSDGAGAVNRVVEIECTADHMVIQDGHTVAEGLRRNFGFAGKKMAEHLYASPENLEHAREYYRAALALMLDGPATEKQAMAAAVILTAEWLAFSDGWVFTEGAGTELLPAEMSQYLADKNAVSVGQRAYEFLMDWVAQNKFHFDRSATELVESYGTYDRNEGVVYIIKSVFNRAMTDNGFDPKAVTAWLRARDLLKVQPSSRNVNVGKRVCGTNCTCIALYFTKQVDNS